MKITFCVLILVLILSSCNKDDDGVEEVPPKPVLAGVNNVDMMLNEFNPSFQLNFYSDSLLKYGVDSIDFNLDGKFDLIINQRFFIDSNDSVQITNNNYPYCKLTLKNDLALAKKNEVFSAGLGQTSSVDWVDTLNYGKRIDTISEWSETSYNLWMWVTPPTQFWGSYGTWYKLTNTVKYIGIKMKVASVYKFGWIKVKQVNREKWEFISYAIKK